MPIVCIERPNRSAARPFRPRDLERIARMIRADGIDPWVVLGFAATGAGVGVGLCALAGAIRAVLRLREFVDHVGEVLETAFGLRVLLGVLRVMVRVVPARIRGLLVIIIGMLIAAEQWRGTFREATRAYRELSAAADNIDRACGVVRDLIPGIESPPDFPAPPLPPIIRR